MANRPAGLNNLIEIPHCHWRQQSPFGRLDASATPGERTHRHCRYEFHSVCAFDINIAYGSEHLHRMLSAPLHRELLSRPLPTNRQPSTGHAGIGVSLASNCWRALWTLGHLAETFSQLLQSHRRTNAFDSKIWHLRSPTQYASASNTGFLFGWGRRSSMVLEDHTTRHLSLTFISTTLSCFSDQTVAARLQQGGFPLGLESSSCLAPWEGRIKTCLRRVGWLLAANIRHGIRQPFHGTSPFQVSLVASRSK